MVRYVICKTRYKEFRIAWFYMISFSIISLRITVFILILIRKHDPIKKSSFDFDMWLCAYSARQLENILGL